MGLFFNHVVPALFYVLKKLTYPLALGSSLLSLAFDRTPAIDEKVTGANAVNKSLPGALKDMVGTWKLQEKINVDSSWPGSASTGPSGLRFASRGRSMNCWRTNRRSRS